jgi:hypothetical protein
VIVRSRVKECESAVEALRRRQQGAIFDPDKDYTLTDLRDLAGVRVLAFPHGRIQQIDVALKVPFEGWNADPVLSEEGETLALKYWGMCPAGHHVAGEYQIVPMLTGLCWEVEHSAIYKPAPRLRGVTQSPEMRKPVAEVLRALRGFEATFERLVEETSE